MSMTMKRGSLIGASMAAAVALGSAGCIGEAGDFDEPYAETQDLNLETVEKELGSRSEALLSEKNISTYGTWTQWMNRDTPAQGGDQETLLAAIFNDISCVKPLAVECRRVGDGALAQDTGETVTCNTASGFRCDAADQPDGECDDYHVRFFCGGNAGYTPWISRDTPSGSGDWETLSNLVRERNVCANPLAIECRRKSDRRASHRTGEVVQCSTQTGLICRNSSQPDGRCDDYEVRFVCPDSDGAWGPWVERDGPGGSGDWETIHGATGLRARGRVCENPISIQCRRQSDRRSWDRTGEVVSCDLDRGLVCRNSDQPDNRCDDYQVRFFCDDDAPQRHRCSSEVGSLDSDADGLGDRMEECLGTDPDDADTDGDSLSDGAEVYGANGVGLAGYGADPLRKDLFVEIDYYPAFMPAQEALDMVVEAFADADVSNPNGEDGIMLHLVLDDPIASGDQVADLGDLSGTTWAAFDTIKNKYFDNAGSGAFRYALFADQYNGGTSSGLSRGIPGTDFVVTLGQWTTPGGTVLEQAGTLMHEFGHNLGLGHGGDDDDLFKVNYLSVMNYTYQVEGLTVGGVEGVLDYSRLTIEGLDESDLNEGRSLTGILPTLERTLDEYEMRMCVNLTSPNNCGSYVWLSGTARRLTDFDLDGFISNSVAADLNGDGDTDDTIGDSQNDWQNLNWDAGGALGAGNLALNKKRRTFTGYRVAPWDMEPCAHE